jgi:hypothetical protein
MAVRKKSRAIKSKPVENAEKAETGFDMRMHKRRGGAAGLFIPAGLFIGMGAGFLYGNYPAWMFLGLGAGFLIFAVFALLKKGCC